MLRCLTHIPARLKLRAVRFTCAIVVTWAMLLGFAEAPFAHVHERGLGDDHHSTEQSHAHVRGVLAHTTGPSFAAVDPADDERLVNWFQTVQQNAFVLYVAPRAAAVMEPAVAKKCIRAPPDICSHDPPVYGHLPARAPPVTPA